MAKCELEKWLKLFRNNTYFSFTGFPPHCSLGGVATRTLHYLRSHNLIWRLWWRDCCHAELAWCARASSSHAPKIAPPWGNVCEDEEVKGSNPKRKLLTVLQVEINRVNNFVRVCPNYEQGNIIHLMSDPEVSEISVRLICVWSCVYYIQPRLRISD